MLDNRFFGSGSPHDQAIRLCVDKSYNISKIADVLSTASFYGEEWYEINYHDVHDSLKEALHKCAERYLARMR